MSRKSERIALANRMVGDGAVHNREHEAYRAAPDEPAAIIDDIHSAQSPAFVIAAEQDTSMGAGGAAVPPTAPITTAALIADVERAKEWTETATIEAEQAQQEAAKAHAAFLRYCATLARHIHATKPRGQRVALVQVGGVWYQVVPPRKKKGEAEASGEWGLVEVRT